MPRRNDKAITASKGGRWRWAPGLLTLMLLLFVSQQAWLYPLETLIYSSTLNHFAPQQRSGKVVVVALPESREVSQQQLAKLLRGLSQARAIGVLVPLNGEDGSALLAAVASRIEALPKRRRSGDQEPFATLEGLRRSLDGEAQLARQLEGASQVVIAAPYRPAPAATTALQRSLFGLEPRPGHWLTDRLPGPVTPSQPQAENIAEPPAALTGAAVVGLLAARQGPAFPTLVAYAGTSRPTLLFQLLRLDHLAMGEGQFGLMAGSGIRLGSVQLPTDRGFRLYPYARLNERGLAGITVYPLDELLATGPDMRTFRNKTVLVGAIAGDVPLPPLAEALDALLQQRAVTIPYWSLWAEYGALLLVALLVMVGLPRLRLSTGGVTVVLVALLLLNTEFLLLLLRQQWLPLMLPLLLLLVGFPLVALHRHLSGLHEGLVTDLSAANSELGRMLQAQGELEQALARYRCCRLDHGVLERLYSLGLDFERKRQFGKAVTVFELIADHTPTFRDSVERAERNRSMEQRIVLAGAGPATAGGTVIMAAEGLQNPTLGPYLIEREIGRGAMGTVYLGRDPRIGREVAVKTLGLSAEFEGHQLDEVKERFYREAETAGRLNHPNIVHIYDIGEEQGLAYIAMDYLKGEHLGAFTDAKRLLPIDEVLAIVQQVAEALDYAHRQGVVHRDIKPANIIYDSSEGVIKVTDFGVACLTDSSKTKTGTVLGSPSYMSPEQVAGRKVTGRADIFSLGVTLFQMVTGHLPFEADSLGALMFKIATEPHPKPGKFRKGIPTGVTRIINKCLQKEQADRYQSGAELAAVVQRCRK